MGVKFVETLSFFFFLGVKNEGKFLFVASMSRVTDTLPNWENLHFVV